MDLRDGGGCSLWGSLVRWRTSRSAGSPEQTKRVKYSKTDDGSSCTAVAAAELGQPAVVVAAAAAVGGGGIRPQLQPPPLGGGDGENWLQERRPDAGHWRNWQCRPIRSLKSSNQSAQQMAMSLAVAAAAAGALTADADKKRWKSESNDPD